MSLLVVGDIGLDLGTFFFVGRLLYLGVFLAWLVWLARSRKKAGFLAPMLLALVFWAISTYPMERAYGLRQSSDRIRNLWWCASTAAGNSPWEAGVLGMPSLEPFWATLVSVLALRDPGRVVELYPILPALGIVLLGLSLGLTFARAGGPTSGDEDDAAVSAPNALFVVFFVLLATTQPADFVGPHQGSLWKMFFLKPNHLFALALVPLCAWTLSKPLTWRRCLVGATLLGVLGWAFVIHWVLISWAVVLFGIAGIAMRLLGPRDAFRLGVVLILAALLVAPYVYFLRTHFQHAVSLSPGWSPESPKLSAWGEAPPPAHSLLFLVTLDFGVKFFLGAWGMWVAWRKRNRFHLLWLGMAASAYSAWAVSAVLYEMGRARGAAHVYIFIVFLTAAFAGIGAADLVRRVAAASARKGLALTVNRLAAAALLLLLPISVPFWFQPNTMDEHYRSALEPLPADVVALGEWIEDNTGGSDVILAGSRLAPWIPALSGRRILRLARPPHGSELYRDECAILFPADEEQVRAVIERLGLTHVIVDSTFMEEQVLPADHFDRHPVLDRVQRLGHIDVYRVRRP